jgi:lipopolysaccharide/colanic/teichoic acid biosynthesis glycosyltransferase
MNERLRQRSRPHRGEAAVIVEPSFPAGPAPELDALATPWWKRVMDIVGALAGLVVLSPLFVLTAAIIKTASRGPLFYRQQRVGHGGTTFAIWKFRTMHVSNDASAHRDYVRGLLQGDGALKKLDGQCRLIPLGGILRVLALDELPQLFNVLKGEMSLVGPRPDVLALDDYQPWQRARFCVTPGMTGLWQVSGKNRTTFNEMIRLDIRYVNRRSFPLDVAILLRTVPALIAQAAAARASSGHALLSPATVVSDSEAL